MNCAFWTSAGVYSALIARKAAERCARAVVVGQRLWDASMLFDYGDPGTTIVDRILVDVEGATPVESMTFGRIKALFLR